MRKPGIIQRLLNTKTPEEAKILAQVEQRGGLEIILQAWRQNRAAFEGIVSPNASLQVSAVWACVRVISETVASLPLFIYEDIDGEKHRAKDHYLYPLLHDRPNPLMSAMELRETLQSHLLLRGNSYSKLIYDPSGKVTEIWPLNPDQIFEVRVQDGRKHFLYQAENGTMRWMTDDEVWHIPGLGANGLLGYSPIMLMRKTIGLAMDAENFGARFFTNDARPGMVIEHPQTLSDQAHKNLKDSLKEEYQGVDNSHNPMILEEGMKLHEVGIPPEDAQFLETRKFQVAEIARMFRVPPHLIGDLEKATFSNIEQQSLDFVIHCIRPWLVRWEQSIWGNLLLPGDRKRYYAEHLVDGLLRGDLKSRYEAYGVGKQWGFLSTNDIRRLENMNPVDGGDKYLVPLNMGDQANPNQAQRTIESNDGENAASKSLETRLDSSIQVLFNDVMARVMKREVQDLKALAKKNLTSGSKENFMELVRNFYPEHMEWVKRQISPMFNAFSTLSAQPAERIEENFEQFCRFHQQRGLEKVESALDNDLLSFYAELDGWMTDHEKCAILGDEISIF